MTPATPRPHVTINVAMSADGKISTHKRQSLSLGSREDRYLMDVLRAGADAVVIGAGTLRQDGWAIRVRDAELRKTRLSRRGSPHPLNVVLSHRLDLRASSQFFSHARTEKLVITTRRAPEARRKRLSKHAEVITLRKKKITAKDVVDILSKRGVKRILVEGGGELNYAFLKEKLIDEIYITVTPRILGGAAAPTPVDGKGFLRDTHVQLELASSRRVGDEVFLRYRVRR